MFSFDMDWLSNTLEQQCSGISGRNFHPSWAWRMLQGADTGQNITYWNEPGPNRDNPFSP